MELSRGRKRWVAVLGFAGMALAVDRVLLLGPVSHANAEDLVIQADVPRSTVAVAAPAAKARVELAQRLREFSDTAESSPDNLPDAFATPDEWFSFVPVSYVDSRGTPTSVSFELSAVMNTPDGGFGVIDGRPIQVGQTRRGLKLISITDRSAEVEVGGVRHTLRIAVPTLDR